MIGRITGRILEKAMDLVLIDVSGVAYEIEIPHTTYDRLDEINGDVTLHTHMVVRQDAQLLYGFFSQKERELFRLLIKINKVGPKVAIAILSSVEIEAFIRCVQDKDIKTLNAIPGVGRVMAERLVVEIGNKLAQWETELPVVSNVTKDVVSDAESALVGLGFRPQEAARALAQIEAPGDEVEILIKQALKVLAA
ncbi:MAG: Holliday junction branch migration protein RuvA [Gammaproteobacteria bacterium]|jgi:Holliday junction DNA helicase RuvA|nr:Holliday junction branch migration protein RuvA [Gammaproteobacteria bacterium]|tara:strand:+ start:2940 stop:3524 length:585 start_codon:yes stop_codon:yes gene_type:complete